MRDYNAYKFSQIPGGVNENRWADEEEIKADLRPVKLSASFPQRASGLPVISDGDLTWVDNSDAHSLVIGSTGSKKTRLFVMPALELFRRARESVVVTDPKGELYERSALAFEKAGYEVRVLNLRNPARSDCWNPLQLAREYWMKGEKDRAAAVVADLAMCLIPEKPGSKMDPFWDHTTRSILRGLCMAMVENPKDFALQDMNLAMLKSLSRDISEDSEPGPVYRYLKENYPEDSLAVINIDSVIRGSSRTFENICVSYDASVSPLYVQHSLIEMLSSNNMDFHAFGRKPVILYLIVPDEKTSLNMIVTLCVTQLYQQLIDEAQNSEGNRLPRRVNFLLDEFSNFPAIPDFSAMISAGRSRNIRFHLIIQGLEQMVFRYGRETAQTIKANCQNWFFLCSRELELLNEISALCGENHRGTPLITPVQLQHLRKERGECLVLLGRHYPYIAHLPDISEYLGQQNMSESRPLPMRKVQTSFRSWREAVGFKTERPDRALSDLENMLF